MQFAYVKDLVAAMIASMEEPGAVGEAFNVGNTRALSQLEACARSVEPREKLRRSFGFRGTRFWKPAATRWAIRLTSAFTSTCILITEVIGKVTRVLKIRLTSFDAGLKETYKWYLRHHRNGHMKVDFEDRLIAMAGAVPVPSDF